MENRKEILEEIEARFDLARIQDLSVPERFKLVNFCGLIYQEALFANKVGLLNLDQSDHYNDNKTYQLFALLLSNGTKYSMLERIIANYARNFDASDVYFAQTMIIGVGMLLIDKGFEADSIYNYLMHLLGREFLLDNQNYDGVVDIDPAGTFDVSREVEYKPFEGNMRELKYDILGLLIYSHNHTKDATTALINSHYEQRDFQFYYNLLNISSAPTREKIYENYMAVDSRTQRLLLSGAMAIHDKLDLFTAHYLFNSIIGKYSRYDKDSKEIENEALERLAKMTAS